MDPAVIVPGAGLGAILSVLVSYVLKQLATDRADYRSAIAAEQERTRAVEARIAEERQRADAAQALVDEERALRRTAETTAGHLELELAQCRAELARWKRRPS